MKREVLIILIIIIIAISVEIYIYVGSKSIVKVGVAFNLSGDYSYMGISENKILHFLLDNYFKKLKVKLKVMDDESSPTKAKQVIKELDKWGAQIIIGGAISKVGIPESIETTKRKIPFLGTTSTSAILYEKKDYYFTSDYSNEIISKATGIMLKKSGIKRLLVICTAKNKSYSVDLANQIKKYVVGWKVFEIKGEDSLNVNEIYKIIENGNFNGILFTVDSRTTAIIVQKLKNRKRDLKFFGTGWNSDNNLIRFGGKIIDGFESVSTYPKIHNNAMKAIENKYESLYNESISDFFVFIYNDLVMLKEAINHGCRTRECFYEYLSTPRKYKGIDDEFYINKYGDAQRNYAYLLYVKNENWQQEKLIIK